MLSDLLILTVILSSIERVSLPKEKTLLKNQFCSSGVKSIATPGELRGYWEAKQLYGNDSITWESLLQPTIAMCYSGIEVNWHLAKSLKKTEDIILQDPGMRRVYLRCS